MTSRDLMTNKETLQQLSGQGHSSCPLKLFDDGEVYVCRRLNTGEELAVKVPLRLEILVKHCREYN